MGRYWVRVSADPAVRLYVEDVQGPVDRSLLVIHGGPDWDCSYLREPVDQPEAWLSAVEAFLR